MHKPGSSGSTDGLRDASLADLLGAVAGGAVAFFGACTVVSNSIEHARVVTYHFVCFVCVAVACFGPKKLRCGRE